MDTNLGCSDVWDLLGGQALVMICRWYSRKALTINACVPKKILEILAPKAYKFNHAENRLKVYMTEIFLFA